VISRRKFLTFAAGAAGALLVPELALSNRTIFLPPVGGWPHGRIAHASLIIPRSDIYMWAEGLASGKYHYDIHSEVLSLMEFDPARADPPVTVETIQTPNEWVPNEALVADEWGNFTRGGAIPMRFTGYGRRTAQDDARELALRDDEMQWLHVKHPTLPGC
jgi:hypothetical protein